jgi:nitrilase
MKVAAVQMTSSARVEQNLETARRVLSIAAGAGATVAALPENFALMGRRESDKLAIAEDDGSGPLQDFLAEQAASLKLVIVGGTIPIRIPGETRVAAASLVFGPDGRRLGRYDKIHLFDVNLPDRDESYRESAAMAPGHAPLVVDTPAGRMGVTVCYDLRFPELFRAMSAQGMDFVVVSAAFTVPTGEAHWDVLLRARAIENLCHVVASAQVGQHENGRSTYGHSQVIDCWGVALDRLPEGEGCVVADVDLHRQATIRQNFPALSHRVLV